MGSLFESKQKTTSTQATKIPTNFQNLMNRTIQFANEGLDTPFEAYNAPRIAELSANEQAGIAGAGANAGMYQPLLDMASMNNAAMQVQGGVPTQGDLNQFMNPYVDYVLGNTLNRLNETSDRNMTQIGSMAGMAGAFGGSRHGVLEGANLAELLKSTQEASANTYSDAFDKGMGNWFRSQDLRRGTISDALNIAQGGQNYNMRDIDALMQTGLTERTRNQSVLDFAYSEFIREQQDPYTKAGFAGSVMSQYPTNLFTRTGVTENSQTPSPFSQIAGIGLTAAGLMSGNPAAAAGMGVGKAAITMPANGMNLGALSGFTGNAKGGLIKGYKSGGKVKSDPIAELLARIDKDEKNTIIPDDYMEGFLGEELRKLNETKTPPTYTDRDLPVQAYDFLSQIFGEHPELGATKRNYGGTEERRMQQFLRSGLPALSKGEQERQALRDKLTNTQYVEPPKPLTSEVEDALRMLLQERFNTVKPEQGFSLGGMVGEKLGLPTPLALANKYGTGGAGILAAIMGENGEESILDKLFSESYKKEEYKHGGKVKKLGSGGFLAAITGGLVPGAIVGNQPGNRGFQEPNQILYGGQMSRQGWANSPYPARTAPYQPTPREPFNWEAFIQRHGLNSFMTPQFPNPATPRLPARGPDLSMFVQALQQKLGGQSGTTPRYADGGVVISGNKRTRRGGSRLWEDARVKHDGSPEDITYLLDEYPDEQWTPTEDSFDGTYLPLEKDRRKAFRLALQKHESGAKEYDNPDYKANTFKGAEGSHAFGIGQWQPSSWNVMAGKWNRANPKNKIRFMTQEDVKADRLPSKDEQDKVWGLWEDSIVKNSKGDYVRAFAEHQLGAGDLSKILKANKNTKMANVVGAQIAKNVSAKNETVGQYLNRLNNMIDEGEKWDRERQIQKGGNPTDIVSAEPTPLGALAAEQSAHNFGPFTEDQIRAAMRKRGDKVFTGVQPDGRRDRVRRGPDLGEPLSAFETVMGGPLPKNAEPNYLDSRISGTPVEVEDLEPLSRFIKGGLFPKFQGGGYVKGYAKGDLVRMPDGSYRRDDGSEVTVETDPNAVHSTDEDVLYKFNQGQPDLWSFLQERLGGDPFDKLRAKKSPYSALPAMSDDLKKLRDPANRYAGILSTPDYGQEDFSSADAFNTGLEAEDGSAPAVQDATQELGAKEDALSMALREMIMQEIEDRKNRQEPDENKLFGMNVNMPLIKMGLGILANSGYPNSAGEAIGKGILGTLEGEEQKRLQKQERDNNKLKELVNLKYMQAMVESMDPNIKMQLAKQKAVQEAVFEKMKLDMEFNNWAKKQGPLEESKKRILEFQKSLEAPVFLSGEDRTDFTGE